MIVGRERHGGVFGGEEGTLRLSMLFWPVVVISIVSISLFLAGPPSGGLATVQDAELRMIYLIVFAAGITFAAAGRLLVRGGAVSVRYAAIWVGVFAGLFTAYSVRGDVMAHYNWLRGNIHPSVALTTALGEAELARGWDGHYRAEAEINGVRMRLMVDTGASMVLLPYEKAGDLGINPDNLDFSVPVTTANGKSSVAPITISAITIGPVVVHNVPGAIAHPGRLKIGLLGMSFIEKLDESLFKGDKLILRKRYGTVLSEAQATSPAVLQGTDRAGNTR
ncbi:MAG: TIGR02281 family clan AA aspartic protease [Pseudomonadota bacterium]